MSGVDFLSGISMTAFAASGVFFLKFWKASHDRFYLYFCISCWLLAIERIVVFFLDDAYKPFLPAISEANSWVYLIRFVAFLCILFAIIEKNRNSPP